MRIKIFASTILFFFILLILGLLYTQIVKHELYGELSEKNRIRVLSLRAPRGKIYDRKGELLVNNRLSFDVQVIFQEIKDEKKVINLLAGMLGLDKKLLSERFKAAGRSPFIPVKIAEDIEKSKAIRIEGRALDLPGVIVTAGPLRNYIYKDVLSHVTGYLGQITRTQLEQRKSYGYNLRDFVGKDGLERSYDEYLRGSDGGLQIEVDSMGREMRSLAIKEPEEGKDLHLNIDMDLQELCDSLLAERHGAIIAMDPSTGAIRALVAHPGFDPNIFIMPDDQRKRSSLLNNSRIFPMLDRAIGCSYAPGSVFKIVVAAAALDSGKLDVKKTFHCSGSFQVGRRTFHCWKEKGHGAQDIKGAIKNSCNVFFYQLALSIGERKISEYAFKLGLGSPTGIDLPGEVSGIVPTPEWKKRKNKGAWFKGETANYAIGQGYLLTTPIQIAVAFSAISNGGRIVRPFIVEKIEDVPLRHGEARDIGLKKDTLELIKEGLRSVVNSPRGTGLYARSKEIIISGKTGTAQNPAGASHAWFAGFAPFENPGICVVVFIEHGGKGGLEPARFAKKIIEKARELKLL